MTTGLLILLILTVFSVLAFWKQNALMFMILFAISFPLALAAPDLISSTATTDGMDIAVSTGVMMYGLLCAAWSLRLLGADDDE
jgi:hypothetical protein